MSRYLIAFYGAACYALFNLVFLALAGFLLEIGLEKTINSGPSGDVWQAVSVDLALILAFGFFHSLMAREGFKKTWTRVVPPSAERSTYVLQASLFLILLMWQWQPLPFVIWHLQGPGAYIAYASFVFGNIIVLWATHAIDHYELFGLRQSWAPVTGKPIPKPAFKTPTLYRIVRHPMQLGALIVFWSTPHMTAGHALFAASMTVYVLIGLYFEEGALRRQFGQTYASYQRAVPMLIPLARKSRGKQATAYAPELDSYR